MRILHVINTLKTGGAEKLVSEIVPLLIKMGHEVEVAIFVGGGTPFYQALKDSGVSVHVFSAKGSVYNPCHIVRLRRLIKQFDVIHTHNTSPQLFAAIASLFIKTTLVTTEHSTENRKRSNPILKLLDRWMYGQYNKIICISNQVEKLIYEYLPSITNKLITIYNGIDIDKYKIAAPLNLPKPKKFIICMVAGFRYQKDHETALKALSHLDKTQYELWLVGDGVRRPLIEDTIKALGLTENVKLWGIRMDVPSLLKRSDIVLQSSHIEGFGLAAVEGMAAGRAVVASDVPGLHEVVENAGVLFKHGDDIELSNTIKRLAEDSEMRSTIARKCSERAEVFSISRMVDAYSQLYNSLLN